MEEGTQQDGNTQDVSASAPVDTTPDESAAPAASTESSETPAPEAEAKGDEDSDVVLDTEGNKYIPHDRVEKIIASRLAKMAEQKNAAVNNVMEAIRTNPEIRKQVLDELGVAEPASSDQQHPEPEESSAFDQFLAQHVPETHRAHYNGLYDAVGASIMPHVKALLEERLSPMLSFIGKQEINAFASKHPDYGRYAEKIKEAVRSGRFKSLEDAYRALSWDDKMKGAGAAAIQSEQARKAKQAGTPIRRAPGSGGNSKPKFGSIEEALRHHADRLGM